MNDEGNRAAHLLRKWGIRNGDRVSLVLLNCVEFLEVYFACAKLGAILVPLNFRLAGREAEDYHGLQNAQPTGEPIPERPVEFDDPLAVVYTSGVRGDPKGVMYTHKQTYFKNFHVAFYAEARPDDVFVAQMPLFHSVGLFIVATPTLCAGLTMRMRRGFDPAEFAEDIERYRGTVILALTTMWQMILKTGKLYEIDTNSVRCVFGGGERIPPDLFEELGKRGFQMMQGLGETEDSLGKAI